MKTKQLLLIILAVIASISFVSCSKDDDTQSEEVSIFGTWKGKVDEEGDYSTWTFREDGTGTYYWSYDDSHDSFTYIYDEETKRDHNEDMGNEHAFQNSKTDQEPS